MLNKFFSKKNILLVFSILVILILAGNFIYFSWKIKIEKEKIAIVPPSMPEESIIERQLRELDALQEGLPSLTEEEISQQTEELDNARKEAGLKPLTQEEIQKQIDALNKLRQQQ